MVTDATTILVVGCGSIVKRYARLLAERDDGGSWCKVGCESSVYYSAQPGA